MSHKKLLLAFFGHHKCASRWTNEIISSVCFELKLHHVTTYNPKMFDQNLADFVNKNEVDFLTYSNADYNYVQQLTDFKGFHIVRDPRDVCVSAYFSHLHSHSTEYWPELVEHREKLQNLSKHDGLLEDMKFNERFMNEMYSWDYSTPNVLQLSMEDLTQKPYYHFVRIFNFLGLVDEDNVSTKMRLKYALYKRLKLPLEKLPVERVLGIIWEKDFTKKTQGRTKGDEDIKNHYRKGIAGDWRNHFDTQHTQFFKDNYNHVLLKLGYEQDPDWN